MKVKRSVSSVADEKGTHKDSGSKASLKRGMETVSLCSVGKVRQARKLGTERENQHMVFGSHLREEGK